MVRLLDPSSGSKSNLGGEVCLEFHGITVRILGGNPGPAEEVGRDFNYFRIPALTGPAEVTIRCHASPPPWEDLPQGESVLVQPNFVAYRAGGDRWVDYGGKALTRWDFSRESGDLWGEDPDLIREVLYLLVHSRTGELLDRRGLHRLHALALEVDGAAVLALLPSGGGKTTLGLAALDLPGVRLLSDDIALVDRAGEIHPFPLRVGCTEKPAGIPGRHLRRFNRRQHGEKWLIDVEALAGGVGRLPVPPRALVLGERLLNGRAHMTPLAWPSALGPLLREMVIGLGLPQLVEYFLRMDPLDPLRKSQLAASRALAAAQLLRRSQVHRLGMGRDLEQTARCWRAFLGGER